VPFAWCLKYHDNSVFLVLDSTFGKTVKVSVDTLRTVTVFIIKKCSCGVYIDFKTMEVSKKEVW